MKYFFKRPLGILYMSILMSISEGWFLNSQDMEWNLFQNFSHIVKTWILMTIVGTIQFSANYTWRRGERNELYQEIPIWTGFVNLSRKQLFWGSVNAHFIG